MVRHAASRPARNFVFTLYEREELSDAAQEESLTSKAVAWTTGPLPEPLRYLVCQLERGNERNRLHLQGYVQCSRPQRFSCLHRLLDPRLALDEQRGSVDENVSYCTKEDTRVAGPWQSGTATGQGKRSDLESLRRSILEGKDDAYLYEHHFAAMAKYPRVAAACRAAAIRSRTSGTAAGSEPPLQPLDVYVYYGLPGSGKTRRAVYESDHGVIVSADKDRIWFDHYQPGRDIIIDEFDGEIPINQLKRLLDVYPVELPVKGSHVPRDSRRIFITSNTDPINWYPTAEPVHRNALFRRFTSVEHVTSTWVPPVNLAPDSPQRDADVTTDATDVVPSTPPEDAP